MAWLTGWLYRKKLTFNNSDQAENLINFPVLVKLSAANFDFSKALSTGFDLRFTDSNGITLLKYERERYDSVNSLAEIWVKVPQIDASSAIDFIYMYFGNASASDGQDIVNTWDANYVMVQHMVDNPDTSHINDATVNNNDGTKKGANEPIETVSGQIGKAQNFDGIDDYVKMNDSVSLSPPSMITLEILVNFDSFPKAVSDLISKYVGVDPRRSYLLRVVNNTQKPILVLSWDGINGIGITADYALSTSTQYYIVGTSDGVNMYLYILGNAIYQVFSIPYPHGIYDNNEYLYLGMSELSSGGMNSNSPVDGIIDECRISNTARSVAWIKAQYLSMTDTFISYGSKEGFTLGFPAARSYPIPQNISSYPTLQGLVLDLQFDERSGSRVWDRTRYGNHANKYSTASWVAGKFKGALTGTAGIASIPYSPFFNLTQYTLEVWVKSLDVTPTWQGVIISRGYLFRFRMEAPNFQYMFQHWPTWYYMSLGPIVQNSWTHLVATCKSGEQKSYQNAKLYSSKSESTASSNVTDITIGTTPTSANITVGLVRIFNVVKTQAEVKRLYESNQLYVRCL